MQIRPAIPIDLDRLLDIDATVEAGEYLHVEKVGEGLNVSWKCEPRPLRTRRIEREPISDEQRFSLKQIVSGADDGIVLIAKHDDAPIGLIAAQVRPQRGVMEIIDLRVDYDFRRQGIASVLIFQIITAAREQSLRAVSATTRTNNLPACLLLRKLLFDLSGLDTHFHTNHDLVKESATLFWYMALD